MPAILADVQTPALILDRQRLTRNAHRMLAHARQFGVGLRPHLKTLKSIDAARLAVDPQHGGIAVATFNEASYFASQGFSDIQLAVCLSPGRIAEAATLLRRAPGFSFFIDSLEMAKQLAQFASANAVPLRVWIEVDSGGHRTGVDAEDPLLIRIAEALGPKLVLEGVATHAGQSYGASATAELSAIAEIERESVVDAAQRLRRAGFASPRVSAGSTPTLVHARSATGLTEWRAGVYLAGDLFQALAQSLTVDDVALSVVATVISHHRQRRQIVVDAGGLALSKDRSTAAYPADDAGYGAVLDLNAQPVFGKMRIDNVHQEHGEIHGVSDAAFDALPLGAKVRILPNHACMTAAMYEAYWVTDGTAAIVARWPRTNGWS